MKDGEGRERERAGEEDREREGRKGLQSRNEKTQVRIVEREGREGQDRARSSTSSGQAREGAEWKLLLRSAVFLLLKGSSPCAQHERLGQA